MSARTDPLTGHMVASPPSVWFDRPHPNSGVPPPITPSWEQCTIPKRPLPTTPGPNP